MKTTKTITTITQFGQNWTSAMPIESTKPVRKPTNGMKLRSPVMMPIARPKLSPTTDSADA